jgi:phosphopantetheine--protein transferase-like protein
LPPVGNDVVDLADSENIGKSEDVRFCHRVFNDEELSAIAGSDRPDSILWAIWAAKEAAYKAVSRGNPSVCSIPKKYPVFIEPPFMRLLSIPPVSTETLLDGKVKAPLCELTVRISIVEDSVHAVAVQAPEALRRIISRVKRMDSVKDDSSEIARKILLEEIKVRLGCHTDDLSIVKEKRGPGVPFVFFRGRQIPAEISLSHDGRFVAFAFDPATL